jgi:hypothetical protein
MVNSGEKQTVPEYLAMAKFPLGNFMFMGVISM